MQLRRRRRAVARLWLSVVGIVAQDVAIFGIADGMAAGVTAAMLQTVVLLVGIALVVLARLAAAQGWFGGASARQGRIA